MRRREHLATIAVAATAGCLGTFWDHGPRLSGPTEEDPDAVDVRYRRFTEEEIRAIRADADEIPYDDLRANIDAHVGAAIVFRGLVVVTVEREDHAVYRIIVAGDSNRLQWIFGSWTGRIIPEGRRITGWGEVLGPETFTEGMGEELTVPAIAIADVDVHEG